MLPGKGPKVAGCPLCTTVQSPAYHPHKNSPIKDGVSLR